MGLGLGQESRLQRPELSLGAVAGLADPHAEVERHLVVARARGVQPSGDGADQLAQAGLHVHVDVFEFLAEREGAGVHLGQGFENRPVADAHVRLDPREVEHRLGQRPVHVEQDGGG